VGSELLAIHDWLVAVNLLPYGTQLWQNYGLGLVVGAMTLALAQRYFAAFATARSLNQQLEQGIARKTAELDANYRQMAAYEKAVALADERQRLIRDMHDGIGSQLITTVSAVERGQMAPPEVAALLRDCIDDLRIVFDSLEPAHGDLGLALASLRYRLAPRLKGHFLVLGDLVEVHVLVDLAAVGIDHAHVGLVLGHGGDAAQLGRNGGQLGRGQVHVGVLAQAVGEVAGAGADHGGAFAHLGLVAHAQAAARHFGAGTGRAEHAVVAFLGQLGRVHLGRRGHPQLDRDVALAFEQLGRRAEVADVGHARADEHFVDLGAGHWQTAAWRRPGRSGSTAPAP
jgi:hypothetical protein